MKIKQLWFSIQKICKDGEEKEFTVSDIKIKISNYDSLKLIRVEFYSISDGLIYGTLELEGKVFSTNWRDVSYEIQSYIEENSEPIRHASIDEDMSILDTCICIGIADALKRVINKAGG